MGSDEPIFIYSKVCKPVTASVLMGILFKNPKKIVKLQKIPMHLVNS